MEDIRPNDKFHMSQDYLKWGGGVTELNVPTRVVREQKIRVVIKNLLDYLIYKCSQEDRSEIYMSIETFQNLIRIDTDLNTYRELVQGKSPKLYKESRLKSQFILDTLDELISSSKFNYIKGDAKKGKYIMLFPEIAYDLETCGYIKFTINKDFVDTVSPRKKYNPKYLVDGMILNSVYSKNLHSFIYYYLDVFQSQKFSKNKSYNMTTFDQIEQYVGIRYNKVANKYDKKTKCYPKSKVVDILRDCVNQINEKTRIVSEIGELDFEVIYGKHNGKAVSLGVRFFFKEVQ